MDISNIVVAIMALIGTLGGAYLGNSKTTAVIQEQIKELRERVDKHNNLIERMYKVESDVRTAFIKIDEISEKLKD